MATPNDAHRLAAARLREAQSSGVACAPVRDLLEGMAVADAYAVQMLNTEIEVESGAEIIGWKAGLTAAAVRAQLGVDTPDFGALLNTCAYGDNEDVPLSRLLQPKVEAEIAFVLERDLPERRVTGSDVVRATAFVLPALEIVASRIANWDITLLDTVADNASSGLFTLGYTPVRLADVDLGSVRMTMSDRSGVVSKGTGRDCLGHPVNAVVWLANTLWELGRPLRAGELVLSGALGPMAPVTGSGHFEAVIEGVGSVRAEFVDG